MKKKLGWFIILVFVLAAACNMPQPTIAQKTSQDLGYTYRTASSGGTGKFYFGREIAQVIGPAGIAWLDRNSRPQEENTQLAIDKIDIPTTGAIADIGAGSGYYTFKLAPRVPRGKVFAVEIQDEMIAAITEKKKKLNNTNVEVVKGGTASPNLPENSVDLAVMVDVYHELEYPAEMLQAISRSLKKDGKILLIEYKGEDPAVAIRPLHKTTVAQLRKELSANGFQLEYEGKFLPIQHFLIFSRKK